MTFTWTQVLVNEYFKQSKSLLLSQLASSYLEFKIFTLLQHTSACFFWTCLFNKVM